MLPGMTGWATAGWSALLAATLVVPCQPAQVDIGSRSVIEGATLALRSSQALIMSGNYTRDVPQEWMEFVAGNFIEPTIGTGYVNTPVITDGQWWPFTGLTSMSLNDSSRAGSEILDRRIKALISSNQVAGTPDDPIAVLGYSGSAFLAAVAKRNLVGQKASSAVPPASFIMLSDSIRPNGGLFSRFYGFGLVNWTPVLSAPTDTPFPTYDISRQYDLFSDFPKYPLNLLADVNALFGLLNHNYRTVTINPEAPNFDPNTVVQHYGDTTYYLIPSKLPLLYPLHWIGLGMVADFIEPVMRVFVELGYDRQTPYGQYTTFALFPKIDFAKLVADLGAAAEQSFSLLKAIAAQDDPATQIRAAVARRGITSGSLVADSVAVDSSSGTSPTSATSATVGRRFHRPGSQTYEDSLSGPRRYQSPTPTTSSRARVGKSAGAVGSGVHAHPRPPSSRQGNRTALLG
jgi:hypothetical protein